MIDEDLSSPLVNDSRFLRKRPSFLLNLYHLSGTYYVPGTATATACESFKSVITEDDEN